MSYPAACYNQIFEEVKRRFGMTNASLTNDEWIGWRVQVKKMFDNNVSVAEILGALDEAAEKRHWPGGTAFWHRVYDVVLKNRREQLGPVKQDRGMEAFGSVLSRIMQR